MSSFSHVISLLMILCLIADPAAAACFAAINRATSVKTDRESPLFTEQALMLAVVASRKPVFRDLSQKLLSYLDSSFPGWRNPIEPLVETVGKQGRKRFEVQWPEKIDSSKKSFWSVLFSKKLRPDSGGGGSKPHWNPKWVVPEPNELKVAEEVIENLAREIQYAQGGGVGFIYALYKDKYDRPVSRARILRSIYYLEPDVAGAIIASFGTGLHGDWSEILNPTFSEIETDLMVEMVRRAMVAYVRDTDPDANRYVLKGAPSFRGKPVPVLYNLVGLAGVMADWPPDFIKRCLDSLSDDQLHPLAEQVAQLTMTRVDIYQGGRVALHEVLKLIPPEQLHRIRARLAPDVRDFLLHARLLPTPVVPAPAYVNAPMPRVIGRAVARLEVIRDRVPPLEALLAIPRDSIAAMSFLPTSDVGVGPFRGIITFSEEGETSHAQSKARHWKIPHAAWPGPDSLEHLDGKMVLFEVTQGGITLREAPESSSHEPIALYTAREKIQVVPANLAAGDDFLGPGHPGLRDPGLVGYKVAQLNQLAQNPPKVSDPRMHIRIETGAAFPFNAFAKALERKGMKDQYFNRIRRLPYSPLLSLALGELERLIRATSFHMTISGGLLQSDSIRSLLDNGIFVRTSTNAENLPAHPGFASGAYKTIPHVTSHLKLIEAVKEAWASIWSESAYRERDQSGVDHNAVYPAVWLVPSVMPDYSFVIHTSHVSRGKPDQMLMESVQGLGESLVGNNPLFRGFPTHIVYDKARHSVIEQWKSTKHHQVQLGDSGGTLIESIDESKELLSHADLPHIIEALSEIGGHVERFFNQPQEVEGILTADSKNSGEWTITLVQTKAIDTPISDEAHFAGAWWGTGTRAEPFWKAFWLSGLVTPVHELFGHFLADLIGGQAPSFSLADVFWHGKIRVSGSVRYMGAVANFVIGAVLMVALGHLAPSTPLAHLGYGVLAYVATMQAIGGFVEVLDPLGDFAPLHPKFLQAA